MLRRSDLYWLACSLLVALLGGFLLFERIDETSFFLSLACAVVGWFLGVVFSSRRFSKLTAADHRAHALLLDAVEAAEREAQL